MLARVFRSKLRVPMYALALLLTFGLVVGVAGCGGEQPATTTDESQATSDQGDQTQDQPQDETADETMDETTDETDETADTSDQEETDETDEGMTDEAEQDQPDEDAAEQDEATASEEETTEEGEVDLVARGQTVAQSNGCLGCHSIDGSQMVGPTWKDAYGSDVSLESGETVAYDEEYTRNSIRNPNEQIHEGYQANIMQPYGESRISEDELQALIAYIESLSEAAEDGE